MIASILGLLLFLLAIVLILDLTPRRVTDDLLQLITPHQTLYERVKAIRGGKRKKGIYYKLMWGSWGSLCRRPRYPLAHC